MGGLVFFENLLLRFASNATIEIVSFDRSALFLEVLDEVQKELMRIMLVHWVKLFHYLLPQHVNGHHFHLLLPESFVE